MTSIPAAPPPVALLFSFSLADAGRRQHAAEFYDGERDGDAARYHAATVPHAGGAGAAAAVTTGSSSSGAAAGGAGSSAFAAASRGGAAVGSAAPATAAPDEAPAEKRMRLWDPSTEGAKGGGGATSHTSAAPMDRAP